MQIADFKLERYFAEHEFRVRYLLSASDCESMEMAELVALAGTEARALWDGLTLGYTESQGHPRLRTAIARQYATVNADEVLVAAPEEAIFVAMHALLRPGDEVVTIWPAYQSLHAIAEAIGCRVVRWPLAVHGGEWRLDIAALEAAITARTRLIIVNFPHNPTGYLPAAEEFDAILAIAQRRGLYLFSDEMYRLLEHDEARRLPAACDRYERGVTLSGLSKSFGLPGLRIGWLATHDRAALARCIGLKDYTTICSSAPAEVLGIMALEAAPAIVARNLAIVRENLVQADAFFARRGEQFEWLRPAAGSVAFPRLATDEPVGAFCQNLLEERDAMLVPADMFDFAGNHFRLGLGRRSFPGALAVLDGFIRARIRDNASGPSTP